MRVKEEKLRFHQHGGEEDGQLLAGKGPVLPGLQNPVGGGDPVLKQLLQLRLLIGRGVAGEYVTPKIRPISTSTSADGSRRPCSYIPTALGLTPSADASWA